VSASIGGAAGSAPGGGEESLRLHNLRRTLARANHPPFLISALPNIRYLTGFTGSNGYLLVAPEMVALFTDGRYEIQAHQQTQGIEILVSTSNFLQFVAEEIRRRRVQRLGFERNRMSFQAHEFLRGKLRGRRLVPLDGLVERQRMVKSPLEVARIRRAVELNSRAFDVACTRVRPGWTEMRFAAEIEYQMKLMGASKPAFDTIVASGARSALPHASPQPIALERNSPIVVDQGAILDDYVSDMTRLVCLGRLSSLQRLLFRAVREAQQAAIDAVKAGVKAHSVDRKARQVLKKFKLDQAFAHSTGHGIGLEIHEQPRIGSQENVRLASGMVITIEPGAYVEGVGGVRIEDVVVVTSTGCEVLTRTPRHVRVL
jgi:Xaa-Pro aminopeptidase